MFFASNLFIFVVYCIALCESGTIYSLILLLMSIWIVSSLALLIILLGAFLCLQFGEHMCVGLLNFELLRDRVY